MKARIDLGLTGARYNTAQHAKQEYYMEIQYPLNYPISECYVKPPATKEGLSSGPEGNPHDSRA